MTKRLIAAMAGLVAVIALALAIPMASVVATSVRSTFISSLEVDALATATAMAAQPEIDWQTTAERMADLTGARVVVVDADHVLVADSDNTSLDRDFDRPEIDKALAGLLTADVRPSETLGEDLRYVAAPIVQGFDVVAAVRLSLPESIVTNQVRATAGWLVLFVISVAVAAAFVAWILARSMAGPLNRVAQVASDLPDDLALRANEFEGPREVRSVARALNSTAERLGGILQRTQRVAADASHHLRTPLTGIRLRLEAIDDISTDDDVRHEAEAALREVDRLHHRIDQVLALARSDAGERALVDEDASAVTLDRVDAAQAAFDERGLELTAHVEREVRVRVPVGLVARIVDELLGNAINYATARVEVGVEREDGLARITVADDGPGVPVAERNAVFERFRRGAQAVPGGSGLGLALVRESVEAVGGSAVADESAAGGALLIVTLPCDEWSERHA